jgi:transcriptional regulator with XRE-family HTH domain
MEKFGERCDAADLMVKKRWRRAFFREWLAYRGMSQEELAAAIGISVPYMSQLVNGERRWNQDIIDHAAIALGITGAQLLSRLPPRPGEPEDIQPEYVASRWEELSPRDRARALLFIEGLRHTDHQ